MPAPAAELLAMMKKDPVRAFVGIPIAAAASPNPSIIVPFQNERGGAVYNRIQLPVWSGNDWAWWGNAAIRFQALGMVDGVLIGGRSELAVRRVREKFDPLHAQMLALGAANPDPKLIAQYYDKAVRLVIAVKNITRWESMIELWLRDTFTTMPITAGESIAWLAGAGGDALAAIAKAAGKVAGKMGAGLLAGLGTIGTLALIYVGFQYLNRRSDRHGEEEA